MNKLNLYGVATFLLIAASITQQSHAKVVFVSKYASPDDALKACVSQDVLIVDVNSTFNQNPPNGLQVVGGQGTWNLTGTISDLTFFNHTPRINQTSGKLKRVISTNGVTGKLTWIDSCAFYNCYSSNSATATIDISGFMRSCTFLFNGVMGSDMSFINSYSIRHHSPVLINVFHPVGDGSGSYIMDIINQGSGDWTPVHIVNGRGISVAHLNAEYLQWCDPLVSIENGVECNILYTTPGRRSNEGNWLTTGVSLNDGTMAYTAFHARWGTYRIGGMNNALIGGVSYVGNLRSGITGQSWASVYGRDPYLSKWNAIESRGINFAPSLNNFGYPLVDNSLLDLNQQGKAYYTLGKVGQPCSNPFLDTAGNLITGNLTKCGAKPLPKFPTVYKPYIPTLPKINTLLDGPGIKMTDSSGARVKSLLDSGKTVFCGNGTYKISGTLTKGTLYGAGVDKTILEFDPNTRCIESGSVEIYNATIKGGKIGYAQTRGPNTGMRAFNIRFYGQSICGATFGNIQNQSLIGWHFDSCNTGITTCQDGIPCGERSDGRTMVDKFHVYACSFSNMNTGALLQIRLNGYTTFAGCTFNNLAATGLRIDWLEGTNTKCQGHYITASQFTNCKTAIMAEANAFIDNCTITSNSTSSGIQGSIHSVFNTSINGCAQALTGLNDFSVVANCESNGQITIPTRCLVYNSTFSNLQKGTYFGTSNITNYVQDIQPKVDQTPPTAPTNLNITVSGTHNVITWNASKDDESGVMQYIIERKGEEIGRTNFNYSANYHLLPQSIWAPGGYPGIGVYKIPYTTYIDSNTAGNFTLSDYKVIAVNFAQIRSDGSMAKIRFWPHNSFPQIIAVTIDSTRTQRLTDSVRVPIGSLTLPNYQKVAFKAVKYLDESCAFKKGPNCPDENAPLPENMYEQIASTHNNIKIQPLRNFAPEKDLNIYDIRGKIVGSLSDGLSLKKHGNKLSKGTYILSRHKKVLIQ